MTFYKMKTVHLVLVEGIRPIVKDTSEFFVVSGPKELRATEEKSSFRFWIQFEEMKTFSWLIDGISQFLSFGVLDSEGWEMSGLAIAPGLFFFSCFFRIDQNLASLHLKLSYK